MIPSRRYGPWAPDLDPAERRARLRALRAIARLIAGPRVDTLVRLLAQAEGDDDVLVPAADALDRLEPLDRRKILASYSGLGTRPGTGLSFMPRHAREAPSVTRYALCLAAFLITAWPHDAGAQDYQARRTTNALNDLARAQRDQAESLRRLETIQRDRARAADTARHNAERDSRSLRRFDRP